MAALSQFSVGAARGGGDDVHMWLVVAYLDAGTGSMLMQALAGGLAGVAVVGKLYWRRIKRVFARRDPGDHLG